MKAQAQRTKTAGARASSGGNKRQEILAAAANRFASQGFAGASMREIALDSGVQPPAIYHYFASKSELLRVVHEEGMRRITARLHGALVGATDPWERLETACVAHMSELLDGGIFFRAVMHELPPPGDPGRAYVITLRDQYEQYFVALLDDLELPAEVDRHSLRLMLLGAMNWAHNWYSAAGEPPEIIARKFISYLRQPLTIGEPDR